MTASGPAGRSRGGSKPKVRQAGERGHGTVIRYDISPDAARAIEWHLSLGHSPEVAFAGMDAREADRYAGSRHARWRCFTFAVRLPGDAAWMMRLLEFCLKAHAGEAHLAGPHALPAVTASLARLALKLLFDLALPGLSPSCPQERAFVEALRAAPGDLAGWHAYADWLQDGEGEVPPRGGKDGQERGLAITHWLWGRPRERKARVRGAA
jgi:uncharacterized protein (TIGR02996 family)